MGRGQSDPPGFRKRDSPMKNEEFAELMIRRFLAKLAHYDPNTRTWYLPSDKYTKEIIETFIQETVDEIQPNNPHK